MTLDELCEIEPALRAMETAIGKVKADDPRFCANREWYRNWKPLLLRLVGWEARSPELRTTGAYDTAYEHLYNLLPDCRDCLCL